MSFVGLSFIGKWVTVGKTAQVISHFTTEEDVSKNQSYKQKYERTNYTRTEIATMTSNNVQPHELQTWELNAPAQLYDELIISGSLQYDNDGIAQCTKVYGSTDQYWTKIGNPIKQTLAGDLTVDGQ